MIDPRLYVDFNELVEEDLVLLSQTDKQVDSDGNEISLFEGLTVKIYDEDVDENGEVDNLIASGRVELNTIGGWTSKCKWNCRIDSRGIRNESETTDKQG
jgi:hypothetical protein